MIAFRDIRYLFAGSSEQQRIYALLQQTNLLGALRDFDPIVIGTFPLDIQTETSDVDIACCAPDLAAFEAFLKSIFGAYDEFTVSRLTSRNEDALVANFSISNQSIEIFGQAKPTHLQLGYLHMVAEHNLLRQHGEGFKQAVINLKKQGIKTEPAFCKILGIEGDPYIELLQFL
jgi:hypothetical protein